MIGNGIKGGSTEPDDLDLWAGWLVHGRQRNAPEAHVRNQSTYLVRVTDRVLRGAEIEDGDRLLDVGAGTGQLALEARRRVGPAGCVVAVDLSHDSLRESLRAARQETEAPPLDVIQADAIRLPIASASVDVVTTRSVLMYIAERGSAIREIERVLRPGGRVSLYEAIDRLRVAPNLRSDEPALAPIARDHERVIAHMEERALFRAEILDFTEEGLVDGLTGAGFASISSSFEPHEDPAYRASGWEARTFVTTQPHPGTLSYEEAAHEVLAGKADAHLRRFEELLVERPFHLAWVVVYVTARKPV